MSKIKNGGLDQYGDELFKQQRFGTAGVKTQLTGASASGDLPSVVIRQLSQTDNSDTVS